MTSESSESDIENISSRRIHSNQIMLDLRHQVQHQERVIRSLIAQRDRLTRELDSRLFLVEAQLRREQKHIEAVLTEKEQLIEFQAKQIYSLKQMLQVSENQNHYQRNHRSSKRSLSKRYSVALDEYMNDHCTVSRALPVIVQGENEFHSIRHMKRNRARSLPELRFKDAGAGEEFCQQLMEDPLFHSKSISHQQWCDLPFNDVPNQPTYLVDGEGMESKPCRRNLHPVILDEISNRRWTSDCDSEHSDSLDSGISSPSIKSRNMHENFEINNTQASFAESKNNSLGRVQGNATVENSHNNPYNIFEPEFRNHETLETGNQKPRRSSSIGNFINRTFSSSSSSEKTKDSQEIAARRHSSFSGAEVKDYIPDSRPEKTRYINSTNKTFGTNHRSVTKPRDIKFRKLFKFRRRTEPDPVNEDYLTV